ncbi:ribosome-inactivating family protein [Spiroplasma endosymbiont of Lonchoptera lutea]|uniref:ribosome-inactivating family protein n=1 Tax=Spiroplasma endosymbiont of Lonchoptera lutea TaxID=3066297 RepID=UPI0030CE6904
MPIVIAAAPHQQSDNLETLKRNKRQNNNIFKTKTLNFDFDVKEYFKNLFEVIKDLLEKGIILNISDSLSGNENVCNLNYFSINSNSNYSYFIIPILLEGRDIQLVFRSSDFYLEGVSVVTNNEVPLSWYYHFSDSTITELSGYVSRSFGFSGNYNNLMPMPDSREVMVRWDNNITQAFWDIINYGDNPSSSGNVSVIRGALARVILATSESIRFRIVRNSIINYNPIEANWGFYHNHITNWDVLTNQSIDYVEQHGTLNGFLAAATILMFSRRMDAHLHSCNRRQARDLNKNVEYCFNVPEKIEKYNKIPNYELVSHDWSSSNDWRNHIILTINLGETDPLIPEM